MLPAGAHCFTVERPWRDNRRFESCIPEGTYWLHYRESGTVWRTTGHEFRRGYEVMGVEGRDDIMLHPANSMYDLEGCIGVGNRIAEWGVDPKTGGYNAKAKKVRTVANSRDTFRELMARLAGGNGWDFEVVCALDEDPEALIADHVAAARSAA